MLHVQSQARFYLLRARSSNKYTLVTSPWLALNTYREFVTVLRTCRKQFTVSAHLDSKMVHQQLEMATCATAFSPHGGENLVVGRREKVRNMPT